MNVVCSILRDSQLPKAYRGEAILIANYLHNRLSTSTIAHHFIPFELSYGSKSNIAHLRVIGCKAFVYIDKDLHSKLDPKI